MPMSIFCRLSIVDFLSIDDFLSIVDFPEAERFRNPFQNVETVMKRGEALVRINGNG